MNDLEKRMTESRVEALEEENNHLNEIIASKEQSLAELGEFLTETTRKCS